jgi:hypothetical protein
MKLENRDLSSRKMWQPVRARIWPNWQKLTKTLADPLLQNRPVDWIDALSGRRLCDHQS